MTYEIVYLKYYNLNYKLFKSQVRNHILPTQKNLKIFFLFYKRLFSYLSLKIHVDSLTAPKCYDRKLIF